MIERNTIQKTMILKYVRSVRTHPSAEEVFNHVKKKIPNITLATVYRNLNTLAEKGIISRIEINHEYHYDYITKDHIHLVCKNTGEIKDIEDNEIIDSIKKILSKISKRKIKLISMNLILRGKCTK